MSWQSYERSAEKGPVSFVLRCFFGILIVIVITTPFMYLMGWIGEGAKVAQQEFGFTATLVKYEWFKDAAAQLQKKQADIGIYQARLDRQDAAYKGMKRSEWPRDEREQRNLWESEVAGVTSSYNKLAAEYNAQMAKVNWRYARGNDALPKEYQPYELR